MLTTISDDRKILAMWTFVVGFVHFITEYAVWRAVRKSVGLGMVAGVSRVT